MIWKQTIHLYGTEFSILFRCLWILKRLGWVLQPMSVHVFVLECIMRRRCVPHFLLYIRVSDTGPLQHIHSLSGTPCTDCATLRLLSGATGCPLLCHRAATLKRRRLTLHCLHTGMRGGATEVGTNRGLNTPHPPKHRIAAALKRGLAVDADRMGPSTAPGHTRQDGWDQSPPACQIREALRACKQIVTISTCGIQ